MSEESKRLIYHMRVVLLKNGPDRSHGRIALIFEHIRLIDQIIIGQNFSVGKQKA